MKPFLPVFFRGALFVGLLFCSSKGQAQQLQTAPWNDPAIVWLAPAQAQSKVQSKLDQLQPLLADLTPGTPQHTDLLRSILFYKSLLRSFLDAKQVPQAVETALPEAASLGSTQEQSVTPEAVLRALQDEAFALLKN